MADLLIRNVPAQTLQILKDRAQARGSTLQAEALEALVSHVKPSGAEFVAWLETVRPRNVDPERLRASAEAATAFIREDRDAR